MIHCLQSAMIMRHMSPLILGDEVHPAAESSGHLRRFRAKVYLTPVAPPPAVFRHSTLAPPDAKPSADLLAELNSDKLSLEHDKAPARASRLIRYSCINNYLYLKLMEARPSSTGVVSHCHESLSHVAFRNATSIKVASNTSTLHPARGTLHHSSGSAATPARP